MGWFARLRDRVSGRAPASVASRDIAPPAVAHLMEFIQTRRGVESYIEPQTTMTQTSMVLIAWDGEWTRRTIPSARWGYKFADRMKIPAYDAPVVGYPQRMRDYNARQSHARRRGHGDDATKLG